MKLSSFGGIKPQAKIVFIGELEVDPSIVSSEGKPYYKGRLKDPITVYCSVDKDIEPYETDFLHVREDHAQGDKWEFVNGKDAKDGYYIPGFVADFSKGHETALYQDTTIRQWARDNRKVRGEQRTADLNANLRKRMEERKKRNGDGDENGKGKGKGGK